MFLLLRSVIRKYFQDYFPGAFGIMADIISTIATLWIYWYTAKAFSPAISESLGGAKNYFEYIIVGEIAFALPQTLFLHFTRATRSTLVDGTFDMLLLVPGRFPHALLSFGLGPLPHEIGKMLLTFLIAKLAFALQVSWTNFFSFCLLQIICMPLFMGMGIAATALFLRFGRGQNILTQTAIALEVIAGLYFPVTLFPQTLQNAAAFASPFTFLLESSRAVLYAPASLNWTNLAIQTIIWTALALPLGLLLLLWNLHRIRSTGSPVLPVA